MRKFTDVVIDKSGNALANVSVTVYLTGTSTLATIYAADAGSNYLPVPGVNPIAGSVVTTDSNGRYAFYAADGRYDLTVSGTGVTTTTVADVGTGGDEFYKRITSVGTGLQIPSTVTVEMDAFSGGVNEYPTGAATKTQFNPIRANITGRTIGERKGAELTVYTTGKGDAIGVMGYVNDFGGYSTGGDEGAEGGRFSVQQGDGTASGGFPTGTVTAVASNTITATWANNANLGEQRPLINTSRGVYSTGTLTSGSGTTPSFVIVGTGTSWTTLGVGAHSDLFLEYTPLSVGTTRHVCPITNVTDDTHITVEYKVSEIGNSSFAVTPGSAYNIFKGSLVSSLVDPGGTSNAVSVNLGSGGSNFQVGDTIQQPLGYNWHGCGLQITVGAVLAPTPGSAAIKIDNTSTQPFGDSLFINGNYNSLIRTGATLSDSIIKTSTPFGCFFKSSDTTVTSQNLLQVLNSGLAARNFLYDRTNDAWKLGSMYFSGADTRVSTNSTPQANTQFYMGYAGAAFSGLVIAPTTAPNAGVYQLQVQTNGGVPTFGVDAGTGRAIVNNGMDLKGYSDNVTTNKWSITGSTGDASFTSFAAKTAAPSTTGQVRLSSTDAIGWRNNANSSDVLLGKNSSDQLVFGGSLIPVIVASVDTGSLTADVGSTTLLTVPTDGTYRANLFHIVNRAATTSSTLPSLGISFTAADGSGSCAFQLGTNTGNATNVQDSLVYCFHAKAGTTITYATVGYASVGATSMQYSIHIRLERL